MLKLTSNVAHYNSEDMIVITYNTKETFSSLIEITNQKLIYLPLLRKNK